MNRRQDVAAQLDAVTARRQPAEGPPKVRRTPVRLSVDLGPAAYQRVVAFPAEMDLPARTGQARVPHVEIFRALVEELEANEDLRARIAARIVRNLSK